ncbi:hypothetical protein BGZ65_005190 [Modicella reniformis]|uniref:Uncharacterized protein n=1 Tax=Modicella reniformis TaxID=1440133 RepID=A0A9P6M8M8_9FUNG|nr:hypothetical protein BGZ65_005190 [Modicella reniformis]
MSAINTSNRSNRSIRAPLQAMARRQYSSSSGSITLPVGHSNKKLAGVSFAAGVDVTYAYYNFFQKKDTFA